TVALKDGFNILLASAGAVKDTATIEKVETEPEIYVLPGQDDSSEGAANWFTQMGDLELAPEMEFPEGKLSIKSMIKQVYANADAWAMFQEILPMPLSPEHGMWGMISNFTIEGMIEMGNQEVPEAALAALNAKLNQFDDVYKEEE
ncbi:MAG: beta-galactosidase, partial [Ruminococcus sp.]|nr:beta-galactosidase [Ruminococcus sp.]